jgi:hypothetical protein
MKPSLIEPATFRFAAQCLNRLRQRVPHIIANTLHKGDEELDIPISHFAQLLPDSS